VAEYDCGGTCCGIDLFGGARYDENESVRYDASGSAYPIYATGSGGIWTCGWSCGSVL
jgi:hypothetical protein